MVRFHVATFVTLCLWAGCVTNANAAEEVEIIRDEWGIPHVYADNEPALFYGAGYAMAEDRLFQMTLLRCEVDGRLAEMLGAGTNDQFLKSDRRFRTLGFHHLAREILDEMDADTRRVLTGFADGVNAYIRDHRDNLPPIFARYGGEPEPWGAEDSVAVWIRLGHGRDDWESEVPARRAYERHLADHGKNVPFELERLVMNDAVAVVTEREFQRSNPDVYKRLKEVAKTAPPKMASYLWRRHEPHASHSWVVSGALSKTGRPLLESDPQMPVSFPGIFYEMHLVGGRYNVRGAVIPGTPGMLIAWNPHVAWGGSALGGDNADLFEERLDPDNSANYLWKGQSKPFETRTETIRVKDGKPVTLQIRETVHGPVVNDLLEQVRDGELYAVRHTVNETRRASLDAILAMMRATDWKSFREGMSQYVAPAIHVIYGDADGDIGYQSLVATPKRFKIDSLPRTGWTGEDEWEMLPFEELPSMLNPEVGYTFTANHLPVGTWYPYLITTSPGEAPRPSRLRELLAEKRKYSVEDFRTVIHNDAVNPPVRNLVELATAVLAENKQNDASINQALRLLANWDGRMVTDSSAFRLTRSLLDVLQGQADNGHPFRERYGDRWNSVCWLLNDEMDAYQRTGTPGSSPEVRQWLEATFRDGVELAAKSDKYQPPIRHEMPYQSNRGGFPSFAPDYDMVSPPLPCPVLQSIWSQVNGAYSHIVDLSDPDNSLSMLPPGVSENPASEHSKDVIPIWAAGQLHAAPLSREGVEGIKESVKKLTYSPKAQ